MNSWNAIVVLNGCWLSWTASLLLNLLRLLQKLGLHNILFHCLQSYLVSMIDGNRNYLSGGPHIVWRFPFCTVAFVFNPAVDSWFNFPSNLSLNYSLILFPFQEALSLSLFVVAYLWFSLHFFWFLLSLAYYWFFIVHFGLTGLWPLPVIFGSMND